MRKTITPWVIASQAAITYPHISPKGNNLHHWRMDDIYAIRRQNLVSLCKNRAEDNQSQMARDLGKAQTLINRYITGSKDVGDDIAREVEKRYELPFGWLDNLHPSNREEALLNAFRGADDLTRQAAERVLGVLGPFPKKPPESPQPPPPRPTQPPR